MAAKIDVAALKREISRSHASEKAKASSLRDEYIASRKLEAESNSAVGTMLLAARLKDRIVDFPDVIDLASANGYRAGCSLRFRDGVWNVALPERPGDTALDDSLPYFVSKALAALGIDHSTSAIQAVGELIRFDQHSLAKELAEAFRFLPAHTVVAVFGAGWKLAQAIGFTDHNDAAVAFAEAARELHVDFASVPTPGRANVLARLANNTDTSFFEAAVEIAGAKPDADCLFTAVDNRAATLAVEIIAMGVAPGSRDSLDETALHRAVRRITHTSEIEGVKNLVQDLVNAGVPVRQENCHGSTAYRLLERYVDDIDRDDLLAFEREALAALERLLSA